MVGWSWTCLNEFSMTVVNKVYNHSHGSYDYYYNDIEPVEDVKDGVRKLINGSPIYKHRLINDLAGCGYYDEKVADILLNIIIEHCTEDELKYILSNTREYKEEDNDYIERAGLYWKDLVKNDE